MRRLAVALLMTSVAGLPACRAESSPDVAPATDLHSALAARLAELEGLLGREKADDARVVVRIVDTADGAELFAAQADEPVIPASNMKLVTTACALSTLGPAWRLRTYVGTLGDDLVILGGGDPNLSGRFYGGDPLAPFKRWAAILRERGVQRIGGDLVFDDSLFDGPTTHPDWLREDLGEWFGAPVGALTANDSCIDVRIVGAARTGRPASVLLIPQTDYFRVTGKVDTRAGSRGLYSIRLQKKPRAVKVNGDVPPKARTPVYNQPVDDPGRFAATLIRETLEAAGIPVSGKVVRRRVWTDRWRLPEAFTTHVVHTSSLAQTIRVANTNSQNLYAECLMKLAAAFADSPGDRRWPVARGTWQRGAAVAAQCLDGLGVPTRGCVFRDGSGLSRENRLTARALSELLVRMTSGEGRDVWMASLGVWGSGRGSVRQYGSDPLLDGRVLAKTGYMKNVRALSGYVRTRSGRTLAFVMIADALPYSAKVHAAVKAYFADTLRLLAAQ